MKASWSWIFYRDSPDKLEPGNDWAKTKMAKNIAQLMVDTLVQAGVERVPLYRGVPIWGLGEKYFYGRFLGTAEYWTRVSRSFLRPRCLSDGILSGSGADTAIQSSFRQADDRQHRRPNAIRRQREILFCEPEFQQEPDRAYFL